MLDRTSEVCGGAEMESESVNPKGMMRSQDRKPPFASAERKTRGSE